MSDSQEMIEDICDEIKEMLLNKNRKYGDSAIDPVRIFSSADPEEQINIRLDDKLSRIVSGQGDEDEDVINDLIGYLVLKKVLKRKKVTEMKTVVSRSSAGVFAKNGETVGNKIIERLDSIKFDAIPRHRHIDFKDIKVGDYVSRSVWIGNGDKYFYRVAEKHNNYMILTHHGEKCAYKNKSTDWVIGYEY